MSRPVFDTVFLRQIRPLHEASTSQDTTTGTARRAVELELRLRWTLQDSLTKEEEEDGDQDLGRTENSRELGSIECSLLLFFHQMKTTTIYRDYRVGDNLFKSFADHKLS